jgi:hypothetical protein
MYVVILFTIITIIIIIVLNLGSILAYLYINLVLLSKDKDKVQAIVIKYIDNVNVENATTHSIGIKQLNIKIRDISKYKTDKTDNTFISYKEKIINISEDVLLRIYIMFLKYKYKVQNNIDTYVLRIASTPHRLQCHFDCHTSNLFMLNDIVVDQGITLDNINFMKRLSILHTTFDDNLESCKLEYRNMDTILYYELILLP